MRKLTPLADYPNFARDDITGQILNINRDEAARAKAIRQQRNSEREEYEALKADVQDIKVMLMKLLENGTNG